MIPGIQGQMPEQAVITGSEIYAVRTEPDNTYLINLTFSKAVFPEQEVRARKGGPRPRTAAERVAHFLSFIAPPDPVTGCREWQGSRLKSGYGQFSLGRFHGKLINGRAHALMYALKHGPIPEGLHVRHDCDNPPCCNVDHLQLGTPYDNFHDAIDRGRMPNTRPGAWKFSRELVKQCMDAPRGTVARVAREHGISLHALAIAVRRAKEQQQRTEAA